jgi:hypothetical protein
VHTHLAADLGQALVHPVLPHRELPALATLGGGLHHVRDQESAAEPELPVPAPQVEDLQGLPATEVVADDVPQQADGAFSLDDDDVGGGQVRIGLVRSREPGVGGVSCHASFPSERFTRAQPRLGSTVSTMVRRTSMKLVSATATPLHSVAAAIVVSRSGTTKMNCPP